MDPDIIECWKASA